MRKIAKVYVTGMCLMAAVNAFVANPALAKGAVEQEQLVEKAQMTLQSFAADEGIKDGLKQLSQETKALFIVPQFIRGAFIFGGAGGSGVLLVRDEKTHNWGEPIFYNIGSASFGLQIGGDVSEMVLVVRSRKGLEEFYTNDFKLGANAGIAAGPVGAGVSAQGITAEILSYAKKKGAFAGLAVDGALVAVSNDSNHAYYGKPVRPTDVAVKKEVSNPKSAKLRTAAENFMK